MQMSVAYMAETVGALEDAGFEVQTESRVLEPTATRPGARRTEHRLRRGAEEELLLEAIAYDEGEVAYYLELVTFHGLSTFSFPLDSWKHRPGSVEFKFYEDPGTGNGLSFRLALSP